MNCKQFTGVSDDSIYKAQEYWQQYKNVSQLEDNLSAKVVYIAMYYDLQLFKCLIQY